MDRRIELAKHPKGNGFCITIVDGASREYLGSAAYEYLEEARRFADSQAKQRGWPLINKVEDNLPAAHRRVT